jgi:glycosyltransferase involved in cell wall biosynthesis
MSFYGKDDPIFFEEAFQSILDQTYPASEVVLVQDGPITDDLHQIVLKWKRLLPIIHVINKENIGLGRSLTIGIQHCSHEVVARMDADDICHPQRFEKQINFLKTHPDISVVGSWIAEFEGSILNIKSYRTLPISHEELLQFARKRCPLNHPTVMYRKADIIEVGNYDKFKNQQDYHLWARLLIGGYRISNIPESLLYMRISTGLFQRRGGWDYFMIEWDVQRDFLDMGFINNLEFVRNIFVRGTVRLAPNWLREKIYRKTLR